MNLAVWVSSLMFDEKLWLILGGTGQLGQAVQSQLIKDKVEFIAPTSNNLNIRDFNETKNYILKLQPSIIINCAG
jgi:dTDP-4-dehydrorhamnose reductase